MTAGNPLEAVRKVLASVGKQVGDRVRIRGAATTGSGRYLTGDFVGADVVINEITAQAAGAAIVYPEVDTIFEIGGQDSKYISLQNGVVVDFEMNHACAAGTGSFIEEQAQALLGIDIKRQFSEMALRGVADQVGRAMHGVHRKRPAESPAAGGVDRGPCGGLSHSIASNYLNRVVGQRKIGEQHQLPAARPSTGRCGRPRGDYGQEDRSAGSSRGNGALGAAAIARHGRSAAGWEAFRGSFKGFGQPCRGGVRGDVVYVPSLLQRLSISGSWRGTEPLFYGSRCDRYNVKSCKTTACGGPVCVPARRSC